MENLIRNVHQIKLWFGDDQTFHKFKDYIKAKGQFQRKNGQNKKTEQNCTEINDKTVERD